MPVPGLPTELLRHIVLYYVRSADVQTDTEGAYLPIGEKPNWELIEPLTLSFKVFRLLTLEAWFEVYVAKRPADLLEFSLFPDIPMWARELRCVDRDHSVHQDGPPWDLHNFRRIHKLRLDVDPVDYSYHLSFLHVPSTLRELELHDHPDPSPMVMQAIAQRFPELRVLRLWQNTIWCGLCYTCNVASFKDSPPSLIAYNNGAGLPNHYGKFLAPLKKLHTVELIVGYDKDGQFSVDAHNENLWSGECDQCMSLMYADEHFRAGWVDKKKDVQLRPPSLSRVEWRFFYLELPVPSIETILAAFYDDE